MSNVIRNDYPIDALGSVIQPDVVALIIAHSINTHFIRVDSDRLHSRVLLLDQCVGGFWLKLPLRTHELLPKSSVKETLVLLSQHGAWSSRFSIHGGNE